MHADIDANDIAFMQPVFLTGNTVTDDIIDSGTDGSRKRWNSRASLSRGQCPIAFIAGDGSSAANICLGNFINLSGRHAWYQVWPQYFIGLCNEPTRLAQLRDLF